MSGQSCKTCWVYMSNPSRPARACEACNSLPSSHPSAIRSGPADGHPHQKSRTTVGVSEPSSISSFLISVAVCSAGSRAPGWKGTGDLAHHRVIFSSSQAACKPASFYLQKPIRTKQRLAKRLRAPAG
jgi:hypothetical protein